MVLRVGHCWPLPVISQTKGGVLDFSESKSIFSCKGCYKNCEEIKTHIMNQKSTKTVSSTIPICGNRFFLNVLVTLTPIFDSSRRNKFQGFAKINGKIWVESIKSWFSEHTTFRKTYFLNILVVFELCLTSPSQINLTNQMLSFS